jgi:uridine kinase
MRGLAVVRSTVDSFHRPRAERYRRGAHSPEGYYFDSHNLDAVRDNLLAPLRHGSGQFVTAAFDEPSDAPVELEWSDVPRGSVLVFDGLFLLRPEFAGFWDLTVFLVAPGRREAAWQHYLNHELPHDPTARKAEIEARTVRARRQRYIDGQELYERECDPRQNASIVIDNDDLAVPHVVRCAV